MRTSNKPFNKLRNSSLTTTVEEETEEVRYGSELDTIGDEIFVRWGIAVIKQGGSVPSGFNLTFELGKGSFLDVIRFVSITDS